MPLLRSLFTLAFLLAPTAASVIPKTRSEDPTTLSSRVRSSWKSGLSKFAVPLFPPLFDTDNIGHGQRKAYIGRKSHQSVRHPIRAKRAFVTMMDMKKIDVAAIEAARRG